MSKAESLSRRRRILLMAAASAFLVWQVSFTDVLDTIEPGASWDNMLRVAGFLVWAATLLALFRFWRPRDPKLRAVLDDELTRDNRRKAIVCGYWAVLMASAFLFALSLFIPVTGQEAAHLIMVIAVIGPMYRFAALERPGPDAADG